jgi:hypothetical protein
LKALQQKSDKMSVGQTLPNGTKIITIPVVEMAPANDGQEVSHFVLFAFALVEQC